MLAILTTHPIQYYAPVFRLLQQRGKVPVKVFYTGGIELLSGYDPGFDKSIAWDIPLLEGYPYTFAENTSARPGHRFGGIINPDLIAQIEQIKPQALLVFGWAYHSHLKALRYFKNRIPVYFRGDSTLLDEQSGIKTMLRSVFLTWVYSHVDCAFYPGTNAKAYFKKFGLREEQLIFAPHAVDNNRFGHERSKEAEALRTRLNIAPGNTLILFAGKLEEKKNPLLLLEAFNRLNAENCYLLFAGSGPLQETLERKAAHNKHIRFIGFQNQSYMPVLYQACDLFCLPSQGPGETWGLAVNEAMASRKAVLVSDKVGCAVDLVKGDYNGAVFQSNNLTSLINALQGLIASADRLKASGQNSERLIKAWNFENLVSAIEDTVSLTVGSGNEQYEQ